MPRIVGLDYGAARIGVALSDERFIIASPHSTIQAEKKMQRTAEKVIAELHLLQENLRCEIQEIVIGIPLRMNGQVGVQADEVKHFATLLQTLTTVPVVLWDERLTTVQAERSMREGNLSRKKRSQGIDKVAAALILQSYLDAKQWPTGS